MSLMMTELFSLAVWRLFGRRDVFPDATPQELENER